MDVYDSFRSVAITSRIIGIFSVANTRDRPYTRKWIYSFTAPLIYVAYNIFWNLVYKNIFCKSDVTSITYILEYFNLNLTVIIIYIIVQINFQHICNLISKLHDFDENVAKSETVNRKMRKAAMISLGVCFTLLLVGIFIRLLIPGVTWRE